VTATLAFIVKPFVILGVLVRILNDPRKVYTQAEDRVLSLFDDPRIIKIKRRQ
jgi:hypothetical protein